MAQHPCQALFVRFSHLFEPLVERAVDAPDDAVFLLLGGFLGIGPLLAAAAVLAAPVPVFVTVPIAVVIAVAVLAADGNGILAKLVRPVFAVAAALLLLLFMAF